MTLSGEKTIQDKPSIIKDSDSAHYAHTDLSHITTEMLELPCLFPGGWRNDFTYD